MKKIYTTPFFDTCLFDELEFIMASLNETGLDAQDIWTWGDSPQI